MNDVSQYPISQTIENIIPFFLEEEEEEESEEIEDLKAKLKKRKEEMLNKVKDVEKNNQKEQRGQA